ncbi:sensor histidine kinase [Egicoccus sp. AB-alg2]|uniref:sensor histidine kinase n=1 Tax=Egicoccus sp. AB-alg2 TaxID=3242693 RepID=UPI00359E6CC6
MVLPVAASAGVFSFLLLLLPDGEPAIVTGAEIRASLEAAMFAVVVLTAALTFLRVTQMRRRSDFLLGIALCVLALSIATTWWVAAWFPVTGSPRAAAWLVEFLRFQAALAFLVAAWTPRAGLERPGRKVVAAVAAAAAGVALWAVLVQAAVLPPAYTLVGSDLRPAALTMVLELGGAVAFLAAAVGFVRDLQRERQAFLTWVAAACVLAGFSRVHLALEPTHFSDQITVGDVLRTVGLAVLLIAAAAELERYGHLLAEARAREERGRLARELHDGVLQELTFLNRGLSMVGLPEDVTTEDLDDWRSSSRRALEESRSVVTTWLRPPPEALGELVRSIAVELAERGGARLEARVDPGLDLGPGAAEALLRIVREAISNAVRHGGAEHIELVLETRDGLRLVIRDDGRGFDPDRTPRGVGLDSMRQRAEALGGDFRLVSRPGVGTRIEVSA